MNKNIKRTEDLLARLEQAQVDALNFTPYPDSDPQGMRGMVDDLVAKGEDYKWFWIDATHGNHPQVVSEALEMKRGWNQWTRSVFSLTSILAATPDEQRRFVAYTRKRVG
jgi:hypothetical protein